MNFTLAGIDLMKRQEKTLKSLLSFLEQHLVHCQLLIVWNKKDIIDIAGLSEYYFTTDKLGVFEDANYLKGGIVYADYVTTVSDTYANEIKTPFFGEGLDGLMRARNNRLVGILNGLDYDEYDPETDDLIAHNYNLINFRKEKIKNKRDKV